MITSHVQKHGLSKSVSLFILCSLISSCVTQRQVEYMQGKAGSKSFDEAQLPDYRLKPSDELYLIVSSLDEASVNVFSGAIQQIAFNTGTIQPYGASLMSYSIDRDGNLFLPIVGKIFVKGKTVAETSEIIQESLRNVLNQPVVSVKLVNRFISILGEVRIPGHYSYAQDKLNVYQALGFAGDITDYGDRKNVLLIRNESGKNSRINLDLTHSDILSSDYYNLRPNDVVYVRPLKKKLWGMREFPFEVVFSTITTGLLIYNVMR